VAALAVKQPSTILKGLPEQILRLANWALWVTRLGLLPLAATHRNPWRGRCKWLSGNLPPLLPLLRPAPVPDLR
jgi:hypothetical protein